MVIETDNDLGLTFQQAKNFNKVLKDRKKYNDEEKYINEKYGPQRLPMKMFGEIGCETNIDRFWKIKDALRFYAQECRNRAYAHYESGHTLLVRKENVDKFTPEQKAELGAWYDPEVFKKSFEWYERMYDKLTARVERLDKEIESLGLGPIQKLKTKQE